MLPPAKTVAQVDPVAIVDPVVTVAPAAIAALAATADPVAIVALVAAVDPVAIVAPAVTVAAAIMDLRKTKALSFSRKSSLSIAVPRWSKVAVVSVSPLWWLSVTARAR